MTLTNELVSLKKNKRYYCHNSNQITLIELAVMKNVPQNLNNVNLTK